MTIKITATPCLGRDLKPGEFFSVAGQDYWSEFGKRGSIGEAVFIRTAVPADQAGDGADVRIYRITIETEEAT